MKRYFKKIISIIIVLAVIFGAAPLGGLKGVGSSLWKCLCSLAAVSAKEGVEEIIENLTPANVSDNTLAASGQCGYNVKWSFDSSTGALTISGTGKMYDYSYYSSPFYNNSSIKSVTIGSGVTSIGEDAFRFCTSLTSIEIPDSVTSIGSSAFSGCSSLTSVTIGNSVRSIDIWAFSGCSVLASITVDENNENYSSDEFGVLYNKDKTKLIQYPIGNARTSFTIPDSVTSIGNYAFEYCRNLTSITIGNSVTSIGERAFEYCKSLTSITIPDSVTSIGYDAFCNTGYCNNSSNWENGVLYIGNHLIQAKESLSGAYTIKNGIICIAQYAFYNCKSLTNITIPDSVTSIGSATFYKCTGLTSIEIPDSVTSIGSDAFGLCTSLTSIEIPDSVTSIDNYAFKGCSGLTSVTIPDSVTSIGSYAFKDCTGLTSIEIPDSVIRIGGSAFFGCSGLNDVYYSGTKEQWQKITIGSDNSPLTSATIHYNSTGPDDIHDDDPAPDGTTISFSKDKYECYVDEEIALSGELYAPNGTSGITLEWSVSDATGVTINTPASMINTDDKHVIFSVLATGKIEGTYTVTVKTSNGASSTRTVKVSSKDSGVVHPKPFDPNSSSNVYQSNGKLDNYTTHISLNSSDPAYVESVVINGKTYSIKKDVLSPDRAEELKGKNIVFEYDKDKNVITAIYRCREFNELNQDDINAINNERRINVKIDKEYKWSNGKVYVAGGTREVTSIPFKIVIGNTVPLNYSDLSDNCKNNNAFDYEISSVKLKGIENCGNVSFSNNSFPKTVKLGNELVLDGTIVLPSDFWLGYEDSQKTISAEYEIKMKSGEIIKQGFSTVVINRDPKTKANDENKMLADAATELKNVPNSAISLECLRTELGFTPNQVKYLEKVVMTEIALYTMPAESLEQYVSDKIIEKLFGVKSWLTVQNGKMTIVLPKVKYEGRTIQVDIVCDIQEYSFLNRTFGNLSLITYHAYNLTKNGKREKNDFKNGTAGLNVYADVDAFTKAATDLALSEIKSASKKALDGYETVEQIIFGDTALKILNAAGYNSFFDFGWDLYVNECKKITLSCPVDVYVYDKDDNLCGSIVNGEVTLDTSDDIDLEVINDDKIVTLWEDGYYIKTVSNCNGTLNVTVSEKGYVNGDIRTLTFEDLPLEIGTIYKQGYGEGYYNDTEAYEIESFNDERIQATSDTLNIQSLEQVTISYDANGGEVAESSKTVLEGEYVILPSATKEGYNLLGWSSPYDSTYIFDVGSSFKATDDTTLCAVWEETSTSKPSIKSVSIGDFSLEYKSTTVLKPVIDADSGVNYTVTYTSSNPSVATVDNSGNVTSVKQSGFNRGSTVITCTVTDSNGNTVQDTCKVSVQYAWWQWLIKIALFGWIWY